MEEIKCEQVGMLSGGKWNKLHDISRRVYSADGLAPTVHTMGGGQQELKIVEPIAYDEQNGYLRQDGCVGTLTTDGSSPKHNNRVVEPNYRFFEQAFETLQENDCEVGDTIDAFNKRVNKDGVSPTITTRPDGFKTAILPVVEAEIINPLAGKTEYSWFFEQNVYAPEGITRALKAGEGSGNIPKVINGYRIRKLAERECFRLMGVREEDFERVAKNQSTSSLYHLAGDSIVATCLMAIFGQLFGVDYESKINELVGELKQ